MIVFLYTAHDFVEIPSSDYRLFSGPMHKQVISCPYFSFLSKHSYFFLTHPKKIVLSLGYPLSYEAKRNASYCRCLC